MSISFTRLAAAGVIGLAVLPSIAQAETYSTLAKQGYAIGKLTRGKSGGLGWVVSNGSKKFFCRLNVATAPQWSDLQAGRVRPGDVGGCSPLR